MDKKYPVSESSKQMAPTPLPAFRFTPEQRRSLLDLVATFENAIQLEAFVDLLEARTHRFQSRLLGFGRLPALECHFYRAEMSNQQPLETLLQFRRETYRYVGLCDTRALDLFSKFCIEVAQLWEATTDSVLPMLPHDEADKDRPASEYAQQHVLCLLVEALDLPIAVGLVSTFLVLLHEE
jgi:hypothetical protein